MMLAKKVQEKYGYQDLLMKTYNIIAIIYVKPGRMTCWAWIIIISR